MNRFRTAMQSIETKEQLDAFNVEFDHHGYLADYEPEDRCDFFIANILLTEGVDDPETYIEYVRLLEKFYPNLSCHEGYGGADFDNPKDCLLDTLRFNLQEHGQYCDSVPFYTDPVFSAMYDACLKLGMDLPPTLREWGSDYV